MGTYLNPGNAGFQESLNSEIYVDKSMLIEKTNRFLKTKQKYICVSRPRRFGKSMAAEMLAAYYSKDCDSKELFDGLNISSSDNYEKHLNKYNVFHINILSFFTESESIEQMFEFIEDDLTDEILRYYSDIEFTGRKKLGKYMERVFAETQIPFIFIIDEWDCILRKRENKYDDNLKYFDFLRNLLKDRTYIALTYMTGILPIKKYGEHSALNMFTEISMTNAELFAEFTGFTSEETRMLCLKYDMPFEEVKKWYDGYTVEGMEIYNPKSVVESMIRHKLSNYWTSTETYEALKVYIEMNFDGLKDTVVKLFSGEKIIIDTTTFTNDMVTFGSKDDVLTLLVHLGYLTYDSAEKTVSIPNYEIADQFASTIKMTEWSEISRSLKLSDDLMKATVDCNEKRVAEIIDAVHDENTSILRYNDENSLSCVISIAYYTARRSHIMYREMPDGKGYADVVFIPRKNNSSPAMVIELKSNRSSNTAITQIKNKNYPACLKDHKGEVLLVGINYSKKTKRHSCKIEKIEM